MKILGLDTSGKVASAALCDQNSVIAQTSLITNLTHSQIILPICKELLFRVDTTLDNVDGIAVANGPGSYTGLRIGISAVKGLAFALHIPCYGVSSLLGLAYNMRGYYNNNALICTVMAARQNLCYSAIFKSNESKIERLHNDCIISKENLFNQLSELKRDIIFVGDAALNIHADFNLKNTTVAPPHLRLALASSICAAAFNMEPVPPELLNAAYLEITKAEKDLLDGSNSI